MGIWKTKAISNKEGVDVVVYEDYYKFANYAKKEMERMFNTPPLKWKGMQFKQFLVVSSGFYSNTLDHITFNSGKTYHDKVTFFIQSIYPITK